VETGQLDDAGENRILSSSSSSQASEDENDDAPMQKVHSLPSGPRQDLADFEMRKVHSLSSSKQRRRQSELQRVLDESARADEARPIERGYPREHARPPGDETGVQRRPLDRADRRRSQTFKSLTVPEEVLQAALAQQDHEEEYGDSERPTGPVRRRSGSLRTALKVTIHSDSIAASIEAEEEAQRFLEPGSGAPAPKHPMDRNPEMEAQRAAAIKKVALAAEKVAQKLQKQQQAMLSRRRKRYQSAPAAQLGDHARVAIEKAISEPMDLGSTPAGGIPAAVIFDWDDTLFPTRHVTEVVKAVHAKEGPLPPESPFYAELKAHAQVVESILLSAREVVGRVSIVTLARRPWVETSAAWYLPGVDFEKLMQDLQIDIFYAREHITRPHIYHAQLEEGVDMFVIAKRNAMTRCLRKIYGSKARTARMMHVICVGDSTVEHLAIKEVLWCCPQEAGSFCKTIKLMSDPSVQNLSEELKVLTSWLQQIVACEKDFDISFESEDFMENMAATLNGDEF